MVFGPPLSFHLRPMRTITILEPTAAAKMLDRAASLRFVNGSATAFGAAQRIKRNTQAAPDDPATVAFLDEIRALLVGSNGFVTATFPRRFVRMTVNRYDIGDGYGPHLDLPLMGAPLSEARTDMSFTLFLTDPAEYTGGALSMLLGAGSVDLRPPAGTVVVYPTQARHEVTPVTSGTRIAVIGWVESWIGQPELRELASRAYELRTLIGPDHPASALADEVAQAALRVGAQR